MVIDELQVDGYEQVVHATDEVTGLDAYVAIHSTVLGPALGGLRFWNYDSTDDALTDVLRLAEGMTYKNSLAGLNLGGGKAVINGKKTRAKLVLFSELLNYLNGNYVTAEDVGSTVADMRIIRAGSQHVVNPDIGDPSPATALGVVRALEATVRRLTGSRSLRDHTFVLQGLGHVGYPLAEMLRYKGGKIIATDINQDKCELALRRLEAHIVGLDDIYEQRGTAFVPCALGGILNQDTIPLINCPIVCGSANNQLLDVDAGNHLFRLGKIYGPDYLANAGGVMNVAREFGWVSTDFHVSNMLDTIYERMSAVVLESQTKGVPTHVIADRLALERLEG